MEKKTLTDVSFECIERLEHKKGWLNFIAIGCLILAPIGLIADAFSFMVLSHQKGGLLDQQIVSIVLVFTISILVLLFGIDRYFKSRKWSRSLNQLELLEETIYREVLQAKMN